VTTIATDGDWSYERDSFGDYRGVNDRQGQRTRLKRTLVAAQQDVEAGRLQRRKAGEWEDHVEAIDRRRRAA
jgi:YD repeat-containing protein